MEKRTKTYLAMAHLGAISSIGLTLAWLLHWSDFVTGLMLGMLLIPLAIAPRRKMRDEFIESLWHAGTTWAFITLIICFMFAPFLHGVWEGMNDIQGDSRFLDELAGFAAIIAFYVGFHVKWLASR